MKISNGVKLIVGLGNPGRKYKFTRHNLGQSVLNQWQKKLRFPGFKLRKKLEVQLSEGKLGKEKIILALPKTYMNSSGKAVRHLKKYCKIRVNNIIVIHDDIDLPLGKIRIGKGRGAAGHKGVQSIIDNLKNNNFVRMRVGIKPKGYTIGPKNLEKFVLKEFTNKEREVVIKSIKKCMAALQLTLEEGLEKAMNQFNK